MILTDAGPLVALVHADDRHHAACRDAFQTLDETLATVWPAFTEAAYLLGFSWQAQEGLLELVARRVLVFLPLDATDVPRMRVLMEQYSDLPMDLADAALVRVAEREGIRRVFTVDQRDFRIYHAEGIGHLELIPSLLG